MIKELSVDDDVVPKLLIDRPSDFRFHAAYLIYSQGWNKSTSQETRSKLNEIITSLSENEIDYETFYRKISQYRVKSNSEHYYVGARARIETQRKRDWRRKEAKNARNARHRKR